MPDWLVNLCFLVAGWIVAGRIKNGKWWPFFLLLLTVQAASAAPIRLRSGTIDFPDVFTGDGPVHLVGNRGFTFTGYAELARLDAVDCAFPCDPGQTVSIYASASGNDLPGIATLDGREYVDVGGLTSNSFLTFAVTGRFTIPRLGTRDEKAVTVRGAVTGMFCHEQPPLVGSVCEPIRGGAVATVGLYKYRYSEQDGEAWTIREISYDIFRK